jgi:hypothetical protein
MSLKPFPHFLARRGAPPNVKNTLKLATPCRVVELDAERFHAVHVAGLADREGGAEFLVRICMSSDLVCTLK